MQTLRRQPVQRSPEQNFVEALGMPRMTRNRNIPGGAAAMN
jgi:hypothetical protein